METNSTQLSNFSCYLLGGIVFLCGLFIIVTSLGIIPSDDASWNAPRWLGSVAGITFVLGGVMAMGVGRFSKRFYDVLGACMMTLFFCIAGWIAFASGPRIFNTFPSLGRAVFGEVAIMLCYLMIASWKRVITHEEHNQTSTVITVRASTAIIWLLLLVPFIVWPIFALVFTTHDGSWSFEQHSEQTASLPAKNMQIHPRVEVGGSGNGLKVGSILSGYHILRTWDLSLGYTRAFALDSKSNMYVSEAYQGDGTNARIVKYNNTGELLGWFGKGNSTTGWHDARSTEVSIVGRGDGEFYYIFKIVFDQDDNMYVIDRDYYDASGNKHIGNARIQKFDKNGKFLSWLGKGDHTIGWHAPNSGEVSSEGSEQGAMNEPTCLLLHGDDLLVTSGSLHKLDQFSLSTGKVLRWLGKSSDSTIGWHAPDTASSVAAPYWGNEVGAFNDPFDCKMDSHGRLYVVSYASDPVVAIFDYASGAYQSGLFHSSGYKPQNIILDQHDNLIMSDNYQGSIRFFDQNKTQVATLQLGPGGDYFAVGDLALDAEGNLFFLEKIKNKIYKLGLIYK